MGDSLETEGFYLTLPKKWIRRLEELKSVYNQSKQDVIRAILEPILEEKEGFGGE